MANEFKIKNGFVIGSNGTYENPINSVEKAIRTIPTDEAMVTEKAVKDYVDDNAWSEVYNGSYSDNGSGYMVFGNPSSKSDTIPSSFSGIARISLTYTNGEIFTSVVSFRIFGHTTSNYQWPTSVDFLLNPQVYDVTETNGPNIYTITVGEYSSTSTTDYPYIGFTPGQPSKVTNVSISVTSESNYTFSTTTSASPAVTTVYEYNKPAYELESFSVETNGNSVFNKLTTSETGLENYDRGMSNSQANVSFGALEIINGVNFSFTGVQASETYNIDITRPTDANTHIVYEIDCKIIVINQPAQGAYVLATYRNVNCIPFSNDTTLNGLSTFTEIIYGYAATDNWGHTDNDISTTKVSFETAYAGDLYITVKPITPLPTGFEPVVTIAKV